tara:strand:- start:473 stop:871 length:399 start_codon:yes stop_codon:yes gene_type:complete
MSNPISNYSYEQYMKNQLEMLSDNFSIKSYKRANADKWITFKNNIDLRVQIQWKGKLIHEFLVEKTFWYQRNTNKEDRNYMRNWANQKIQMIKLGLIKKDNIAKTKKVKTNKTLAISSTQDAFEKMKQNDGI